MPNLGVNCIPSAIATDGSRSEAQPDKASLPRCLRPNLIQMRRIFRWKLCSGSLHLNFSPDNFRQKYSQTNCRIRGLFVPPAAFEGADPDDEHRLTRPDCSDAFYQIWFEWDWYFWKRGRFCELLTDGRPYTGTHIMRLSKRDKT